MKIRLKKLKQSKIKKLKKIGRHNKVRSKVSGSTKRPRMSIFRSNKHDYVQIIDDTKGKTLISASDLELKDNKAKKQDKALELGKIIAKKAKDKKISEIVFDRGGYKYAGRVEKIATGAREGGLKF